MKPAKGIPSVQRKKCEGCVCKNWEPMGMVERNQQMPEFRKLLKSAAVHHDSCRAPLLLFDVGNGRHGGDSGGFVFFISSRPSIGQDQFR